MSVVDNDRTLLEIVVTSLYVKAASNVKIDIVCKKTTQNVTTFSKLRGERNVKNARLVAIEN